MNQAPLSAFWFVHSFLNTLVPYKSNLPLDPIASDMPQLILHHNHDILPMGSAKLLPPHVVLRSHWTDYFFNSVVVVQSFLAKWTQHPTVPPSCPISPVMPVLVIMSFIPWYLWGLSQLLPSVTNGFYEPVHHDWSFHIASNYVVSSEY